MKSLEQNIKNEFYNLLTEIKNLFSTNIEKIINKMDALTNLIKNTFKSVNDLIIEKFVELNLNIDTIISITNKTYNLLDELLKEFKLFDFIKLKDLLIKNKTEIIDTTTNCKKLIIRNSDEAHVVTRTTFTEEITTASGLILEGVGASITTSTEVISVGLGGITTLIENNYLILINSINEGFLTLKTNLNNFQTLSLNNFNAIEKRLNNFIETFKSKLNEVLNDW